MSESKLRIRLEHSELHRSPTECLERLMLFLNPEWRVQEKEEVEGQYRHRLVNAISRWEKHYGRTQKKKPVLPG